VADYRSLRESALRSGRLVQVGFQSLGSHAVAALQSAIAGGELGRIRSISAVGSWSRSVGYWNRSRWAGRRTLDGVRVADGAVSNPFAHALMTALRLAGWDAETDVGAVETDLRRVNPIEVDDTSAVRVSAAPGGDGFAGDVTCAFTLAGPREDDPTVTVVGDRGTATLWYTRDELQLDEGPRRRFGRDGVIENLLEARAGRAEPFSPLARTGAFCAVIDAVAQAPVAAIPPSHVEWVGAGADAHPLLADADRVVAGAAGSGRLFRELESDPWAG
jgi:predicted dehydrogenase